MSQYESRWLQCVNKGQSKSGKCDRKNGYILKDDPTHERYFLADGINVECKACYNRRKIYLPPDKHRPCGFFELTEQERTQLRIGLAELRKTFDAQSRVPPKVETKQIRQTKF